jgi:glycosyltransferase involved in cell wall biosynthesis
MGSSGEAMRHVDLLIAAPADPQAHHSWGDVHFARSLQLGFMALGVSSRLLYRDNHQDCAPPPTDSGLLVLRGKYAPPLRWLTSQAHRCKALWLISWPLNPSADELASYDHLFVASVQDTPRIARLSCRPTTTLLQATGFRSYGRLEHPTRGLMFVGNTRGVSRPIVSAFQQACIPLDVIGQGWDKQGIQVKAESIANQELPNYYRRAVAVLNDHHRDMADYGYLNNRFFDVLACKVPVISDVAPGCPMELRSAAVTHPLGTDVGESIQKALEIRSHPSKLNEIAREVRTKHSFEARAKELLKLLS